MDWYYVQNGKRMGPVSEEELQTLVSTGVISSEGLVWRTGMTQWQRYQDVQTQSGAGRVGTMQDTRATLYKCVECGKLYPADEMVRYGESMVCAACKPLFFQRLKEGAPLPSKLHYGGFWIRFLAKTVDSFILVIANGLIQSGFYATIFRLEPGKPPGRGFFLVWFLMMLLQLAVAASYSTFFVGKFAATPGKMACGLKVVTADGGRVSYARALGRYFAEMLSSLILAIGYIMAAFDNEKRTLHDRICNTRVIHK